MASFCRSCDREIVWVKTATGKSTPLDVDPTPGGNVIVDRGVARVLTGLELADPDLPELRHHSHFETCPQAAHWRTRTKKGTT